MEYRTLATLIRESVALPLGDPATPARLAACAGELGVPAAALADLLRLWTADGWLLPAALQDDAAASCYWTTPPEAQRC